MRRLIMVTLALAVAVPPSTIAQPQCPVAPVSHWLDAPAGAGGWHLDVSVGGAPFRQVQIDTGSVGLAIWSRYVGQHQPAPNPPNSGYIYYNSSRKAMCGNWVSTSVTLRDAQGTTLPIPNLTMLAVDFMCEGVGPDNPCGTCPVASRETCLPDLGMLGVGFDRGAGMGTPNENAFLQLPDMVGPQPQVQRGYVITAGGITLGMPQNLTGFKFLPLQKAQPPELWQQARGCVSVTGAGVVKPSNAACGDILVDTGVDTMYLSYADTVFPFDPAKAAGFSLWPPVGTPPIVATVTWPDTGPPQYAYIANSANLAQMTTPRNAFTHSSTDATELVFVNTSRQLIYQADYLYDATCGRIGFRDRTASAGSPPADFVTTVGQTGMFAIAAGELAMKKSTNPGVQTYGYLMVTHHTELGEELKTVAARLGYRLPPSMGATNEVMLQSLQNLSGPAFDRAYVSHMVPGHVGAVKAFQAQSMSTPANELTLWAKKSLKVIQEHLNLANALHGSMQRGKP